jgi:CBS-domain-containing membrane protein
MASMQSLKPLRKVWVGSVVGATATLVVALIEAIGNTKISGTIAVSISTVLSFVVSCLVPPSGNDQVVS